MIIIIIKCLTSAASLSRWVDGGYCSDACRISNTVAGMWSSGWAVHSREAWGVGVGGASGARGSIWWACRGQAGCGARGGQCRTERPAGGRDREAGGEFEPGFSLLHYFLSGYKYPALIICSYDGSQLLQGGCLFNGGGSHRNCNRNCNRKCNP